MLFDAVVLANGEYPTNPLPLKILAEAPYVVCCDGGADEYIRRGNVPDVIIGDGDSISEDNRNRYSHEISGRNRKHLLFRQYLACKRSSRLYRLHHEHRRFCSIYLCDHLF